VEVAQPSGVEVAARPSAAVAGVRPSLVEVMAQPSLVAAQPSLAVEVPGRCGLPAVAALPSSPQAVAAGAEVLAAIDVSEQP
jgi:hypothetical protein